ncbi:MAG: hypothetical protein DI536_11655 [Archangium gephyra]|uniref:Uncharacterized protein n=1 Tax=Archangium gephyra TaxID=48 RepID=A0A2W5VTV4_9BACT|nr:MAG: hypothetical protein DI536_11655 [Archangium gephyra]
MKLLPVVVSCVAAFALSGCQKEGCLGGEDGCRVPPPCPRVTFACSTSELAVKRIESPMERPGGWNGLGTVGDVKLTNGLVEVVIANIGTQNYLDPNGGSIIDLGPRGQQKDTINGILQVVGILPRDAAFYTSLEIIDESPVRVAVQVKGTLDGIPSVPIVTRYELTPCDPGVRVRTEIVNGSTDTQTWALVDGYYWSGRESLPFRPSDGFQYSSFGLTTINGAFHEFPWFAAAGHSGDDKISSFAAVSCTEKTMEGFHSESLSAAGLKRQIVKPRGSLIFERFLAVADAKGISGGADIAMEVRRQVHGERYVTLKGKVERMGGSSFNAEREASVLFIEPGAKPAQWSQVVPDASGSFSARVPAGKNYLVEVHAFGRKQVERQFDGVSGDQDLGTFSLPAIGTVTFTVNHGLTLMPLNAEIFLFPQSEADREAVVGTLHGRFTTCAPWLGSPAGASPACNRVLVNNGTATAEVPLGKYDVIAFHGPFWSIANQSVEFTGGPQTLNFTLVPIPGLKPSGALSSDLHVHGARSFDSSIPDFDRVLSMSASALDVVIGTDHEVIGDYSGMVAQLGLQNTMSVIVGLETTGHIPFLTVPGYGFPLVIGHYNFWPLKYDPSLPRNGAPIDERVEPGELFERVKPAFTGEPMIELNHPWADPEFGRDLGFPRAIFMDLRKNIPASDDGTRQSVFNRQPANASFKNDDHHVQEVMNGTDNGLFLQYRSFWHYTLNQGLLKAGTANSDSHSLTDNTVGVPQNVVFTTTSPATNFDIDAFNRSLKQGRSFGTNGPVIDARLIDGVTEHPFSMTTIRPSGQARLSIRVTAAPWVPVQEIRILVNGEVKKTIGGLPGITDPFDTLPQAARFVGEVPLDELTAGVTGDAWIVVEAGRELMLAGDLGGGLDGEQDGMVDTTDNNGDGVVDAADVKEGSKIGPLADPPKPARGEPGYEFGAITNGYSAAFTNPFILDLDGDGVFTAPGVKGGN